MRTLLAIAPQIVVPHGHVRSLRKLLVEIQGGCPLGNCLSRALARGGARPTRCGTDTGGYFVSAAHHGGSGGGSWLGDISLASSPRGATAHDCSDRPKDGIVSNVRRVEWGRAH